MPVQLSFLDTIRSIWALLGLCLSIKLRVRGKYAKWREATAFGSDPSRLPLIDRVKAVIEYGAWVARMKRLTR